MGSSRYTWMVCFIIQTNESIMYGFHIHYLMGKKMITLEQLSCFKAVYELSSYSKAARKTNKTRATVRERVKALEDVLGFDLFEVTGKTLFPTAQAEHLYARADNLTRQAKEFYSVALSTFQRGLPL